MSADGSWTITMKSPLGLQTGALRLASSGGALTGSLESKLGSGPIAGGLVDGNTLKWTKEFTFPMPMAAEFSATIDGDKMTGTVLMGRHGKAPFTGTRS